MKVLPVFTSMFDRIKFGVSKGKGNKTIASDLGISEHTVKNHIKNILSKLDASDRTEAVMIAIRRGYIEM